MRTSTPATPGPRACIDPIPTGPAHMQGSPALLAPPTTRPARRHAGVNRGPELLEHSRRPATAPPRTLAYARSTADVARRRIEQGFAAAGPFTRPEGDAWGRRHGDRAQRGAALHARNVIAPRSIPDGGGGTGCRTGGAGGSRRAETAEERYTSTRGIQLGDAWWPKALTGLNRCSARRL